MSQLESGSQGTSQSILGPSKPDRLFTREDSSRNTAIGGCIETKLILLGDPDQLIAMPQLPEGQPCPKIAIIQSVHREGVYQTIWYCKLLFLIAGARLGMLLVDFGFQRFVMLNEGLIVIETSTTNASTPTSSMGSTSASSSSPLPTPIPIRDLEYGDSDVFKSPNKLLPEDFQLPPLVPTPATDSDDDRTPPPVIDSFSGPCHLHLAVLTNLS